MVQRIMISTNLEGKTEEEKTEEKAKIINALKETFDQCREYLSQIKETEQFTCPSCRAEQSMFLAVRDPQTGLRICDTCVISWMELRLDGQVQTFQDIIPAVEC
jgi:formiminotetrahydrofolate cyclodeaminase